MTESVIRQSELRNNNAEVMRRVVAGESFVVTVHGRPVADLVPHQRRRTGGGATLAELRAAVTALGIAPDDRWRVDIWANSPTASRSPGRPVSATPGG